MKDDNYLAIIKEDPWLVSYREEILQRYVRFQRALLEIELAEGSLSDFSRGHLFFGINFDETQDGWYYREWAPKAHALFLIGDFNGWNRESHPLTRKEWGTWEIFLPREEYQASFTHGSLIKVHVVSEKGALDRIPAYIRRVVQNPVSKDFSGQLWFPESAFAWTDAAFTPKRAFAGPLIYESHVGMGQEKEDVGTYREFADIILPKIKANGYTVVQLMAVMEHPYYGSFGYHVSSFYAPSSRFGTPEDLKYLVNKAHELGLAVVMDIVHSHAVQNIAEGLNEFDGSDQQYFHAGPRGYHEVWDSKLFDYGKYEVKRFLLSNIRYWMEEFHFDGFRFDGVTSMLYFHHGLITFGHYDSYFVKDVDWDAIVYMQLANRLIHELNPDAISIAEEVSGMPGLCRQPLEGGIGFDFRMAMGIPDFFIKVLKEQRDEEWDMFEFWKALSDRRYKEKTIAYAESHDQALVGDKSIAFWLMDKEMYFHMRVEDSHLVVDRGIAYHKLFRMFTISLGGEGYLNFMGNEFGHPEWIDFPREGNGWSYQYARRQWSLAEDTSLKYQFLLKWDQEMVKLIKRHRVLMAPFAEQIHLDPENKVIIYQRAGLLFLFNFNTSRSIFDYQFRAPVMGKYKLVLNSDNKKFGGFHRIDERPHYYTDQNQRLSVYLTNRTVLVLSKVD
ncbi:1,4-alpha-glucan (glycogen) branching enzyme, GH-13-type [Lunatimonas lonarensis]|uniref:1,4-alpha-glucan branching enzyme n=1 Tax=Lunatimonas lonarensis TaxID=1232681 RepID=R7ZSJ1_9BACT|nr:alpha-amylase family glycosyl hydrolase [Lunatimonas lonarensis]EON77091.1 1,4-alpha-glucan (glycogen) branching enzyme, GH-13-type [Lunatimonas lonarensis]